MSAFIMQIGSKWRDGFRHNVILLTVFAGVLIGSSFSLTKFIVIEGVAIQASLFWMMMGATVILLFAVAVSGERLQLGAKYLRYYLVAGTLGIGLPQYLSYVVLKDIPVSFFTVLITLSPLFTVLWTSLYDRRVVSFSRIIGILIGLTGITLGTYSGFDLSGIAPKVLLLAFAVPALLGLSNLYRSRAYPKGGQPMSLAAGTLLSQVILLWPVFVLTEQSYLPLDMSSQADIAVLTVGVVTAVSYILTYSLQARVDGVSFSQVGYFATITGVAIGVFVFGETLNPVFFVAVFLLFFGLLITNRQINLLTKRTR